MNCNHCAKTGNCSHKADMLIEMRYALERHKHHLKSDIKFEHIVAAVTAEALKHCKYFKAL